jgi:hypothetical protein
LLNPAALALAEVRRWRRVNSEVPSIFSLDSLGANQCAGTRTANYRAVSTLANRPLRVPCEVRPVQYLRRRILRLN